MKNLIILTVVALFSFIACENETTTEKVKANVAQAEESVKEVFNKESMRLKGEIERSQKNIDKRIEALNAKWIDASEDLRTDIDREKKELAYNRKKLAEDLDKMGDNFGEGWAAFKENVKETLQEVDEDLK